MRTFFFAIIATLVATMASISDANAKYSLCNKTSYALSATIGYVDGDRLATRGWWRLRPGQCKVVLTEQTVPGRYFVYAESIPGHKGPLRSWSGETPLCVENSGFFNLRNQDACRDDPSRQRNFFDVEVTSAAKGDWQSDFTEAANYTVYSAEVAGVQRLLRDIGSKIRRIDGSLGRETQRELTNFRRDKSLGAGANIDDATIDSLIDEANAQESKRGFFYCNKAEQPVWSAIAYLENDDSYASKGWWLIEPGDCAKILKGALERDHYYVYGVIEQGRSERRLSGGDKNFCVNAVRFEIADAISCADQDLNEALFRKVNVGGAQSATFDFEPPMFVDAPASVPVTEPTIPVAPDTEATPSTDTTE